MRDKRLACCWLRWPVAGLAGRGGRRPAHPDTHARTRGRDVHFIGQAGDHGQAEAGRDRVVRALDQGGDAVPIGTGGGAVQGGVARRGLVADHDDEPLSLVGHLDLDRLGRAVPPVRLDRARASLAHGQAHLVEQRFVHSAPPRYRGGDQPRGADMRGQRGGGVFYGGHRRQGPGRRNYSSYLAAMASSTVSWMPNTFVSPVILKILRMRSCVHTRSSEPSCARTRFSPPTSTPSPVESRNSTFSMLTTSW